MAARPTVSIYDAASGESAESTALPTVFTAPIRPDVVQFVHTNIRKNSRQAYAVKWDAGMDTAAESWGTGRAVSRIPRVPGGGTHRAGQGAFGNMCRGGRMFAPTRVWRKWHRRVNQNQRRYAMTSALAASAIPALVMARGHRIDEVVEMPLVLSDSAQDVLKTQKALEMLARFGADADVQKAKDSRQLRRGKGKMRNRRYTVKKGPLIIYSNKDSNIRKAVRNLPGVELAHVDRMNLLQLAPGGHLGRFVVWTASAFQRLDAIYGTYSEKSTEKTGYQLARHQMTNGDLARLINSDEVQSAVRPAKEKPRSFKRKKNPLVNVGVMNELNPYALAHRRSEIRVQEERAAKRAELIEKKRKGLPTKTDEERAALRAKRADRPNRSAMLAAMLTK